MANKTDGRIHWSFWVISVFALIWNLMGVMNYLMQMNPEVVAAMPESHRAIIEGRPAWATGGFAIGVFGGALGCLLLLLRRSWAIPVLLVALLGVCVTMAHTVMVAMSLANFGTFEIMMMIVSPLAVGVLLILYARKSAVRGWLR